MTSTDDLVVGSNVLLPLETEPVEPRIVRMLEAVDELIGDGGTACHTNEEIAVLPDDTPLVDVLDTVDELFGVVDTACPTDCITVVLAVVDPERELEARLFGPGSEFDEDCDLADSDEVEVVPRGGAVVTDAVLRLVVI